MLPVRVLGRGTSLALRVLGLTGAVTLGGACSSGEASSADGGLPGEDDSGVAAGADADRGGGPADAGLGATGADVGGGGTGVDGNSGAVGTGGEGGAAPADGSVDGGGAAGTEAGSSGPSPFDCQFAWGEPAPSGSLGAYTWLQFMTNWAGYEIQANGSIGTFANGGFLSQLQGSTLIPVYYAYLIGYYGHANSLPDQNCCGGSSCAKCTASQPNLATGAAYLLLGDPKGANAPCNSTTAFCAKNLIVQAYAYYAQQTQKAWPTKPLVWLIEGDFIQYAAASQVASLTSTSGASAGLSYAQLGQLAALIAAAIKSNMPNAVVAFDDSSWISDTERPLYWQGIMQAHADYDMVWTTGVGNNGPFVNAGETATAYNGMTGTYSWLHSYTGKKVLVDESAGASQQADTWSNQSAATIDALIADGVIAVNVSGAPSTYQGNVTALQPRLGSTCP
jgi:hypothetical protein